MEGYDTHARPFTRSEGRLRATGQNNLSERARRVVSNSGDVLGVVSLVRGRDSRYQPSPLIGVFSLR